MKGFLEGLVITHNDLSQLELHDKATLLMSLSNSANHFIFACLDEAVTPKACLIADMSYLIAINIELAERLTQLVPHTQ